MFKFKKKYFAFFAITPLLLATALIKVPCPVDAGTGQVSNTGMTKVSITSLESKTVGIYLAVCGTYRVYMTDVSISLQNDGEVDANGYISLILIDYKGGKVLDSQMVNVAVPANKKVDTLYTMFFQVNVDDPKTVKVNAKIESGNIADKACGGTGKVALNTWLVINSMKQNFMEAQKMSTVNPVFQPFFLPPEDWDVPYAYDQEQPGQSE